MANAAPLAVTPRRTLFAGALVAISLFGDSYLYAVLPVRYPEAGVGLLAVGWLLSINRYVRLITNPLAGAVGARVGWGVAFAGALWLAVATTTGYGLVQGFVALAVLRALWGLSWSFLKLGGMAAVLADSPAGRRGRLMGLFSGVYRLGSLTAVVTGGYLADHLGFRSTALLFGAATAVGAVIATLPPALDGRWGAPARARPSPATTGASRNWLPANGPEWAACLGAASLQLVVSGLVTATMGLLVKQRLGAQIPVGSLIVGAATITGLILGSRFAIDLLLGPPIGHLADHRGRDRVLAAATAALALGLLTMGQATSLAAISLTAVALFAAATGAAAVFDSWAGDLAGKAPGRFLPAYTTWQDLGAATGPVLAYSLASSLGLPLTYAAGAAILLLASAARGLIGRR